MNSYNDDPLENGEQLGNFYEIESSSPAAELTLGESVKYEHRTIHIQGSKAIFDSLLTQAFAIKLGDLSFD